MQGYGQYNSDGHHYSHHQGHHHQQHSNNTEQKPLVVDLMSAAPYPNKAQPPSSSNSPSDYLSSPENSLNGNRHNTEISNDPSVRRYRTAFTRDQLACLEKEFFKENYVSRNRRLDLSKQLGLPEATIKVWFQNRRMKDKRQRIAVAWPYAAVYSDPAFAASILQAAANSVGMPYGAPFPTALANPMLSAIPPGLPLPGHAPSYGQYRYNPYHIPSRSAPAVAHHMGGSHHMASASIPMAAMLSATMPTPYNTNTKAPTSPLNLQCPTVPHNIPMTHTPGYSVTAPIYLNNPNTPHQDVQSASSPHSSTLSFSPPSDHCKVFDCIESPVPNNSNISNRVNFNSDCETNANPAKHNSEVISSQDNNNNNSNSNSNSNSLALMHNENLKGANNNKNKRSTACMSPEPITTTTTTVNGHERQPKLFKPYKTEA